MMFKTIYVLEIILLLVNCGTMITCEWSGNHTHSDGQGDTALSWSYEILVRENTPVGQTIFSFRDEQSTSNVISNRSVLLRNTSQTLLAIESARIIDGNKNDRFVINPETQEISVFGYLDFDIDSQYTLKLLTENSQNANQTMCIIKITLEDVEEWPPYYNETCKMPTRGPRKGLDMPIAISLGKKKVALEIFLPGINTSSFEVDSNNDECMMTMYLPIVETNRLLDFRRSDIEVNVAGLETQYQFFTGKADFPPDALFNEKWFNIKNDDNTTHYSLLKLMITNINIKAPLIPLQVTVHTRDRILYTDMLWFNFVGCSEGKYGFKCDKECICQNDAECSVFNGACNCKLGWYGPACDIPKPDIELIPMREEVEYGSYTSLTCVVTNTEFEDKNFVGTNVFSWSLKNDSGIKKCIDDNTEDFYIEDTVVGTSVLQIKHGISVKTEGRYECKVTDKYDRVYIASATVKTTCPKNIFGRYCNRSCDCATGASISCDRYLGCECNSGWTGRHCHIDTISPTFDRCPQEITKVIKDDETRTNITWQVPTANDNSNNVTVHSSYTPGDVFVIGTTVVRYTAVDSSNNTVHCQFRVNVIVQEKLKIGLSIGIPIVCIVFLLPLFFFLGYRYRLQLYLVFTRDWDIDEDLGDKDYDGFLSYSSKDGDFAEAIMKNLEKNGKFKLLLHHRDFIAGKGILDNIEDSFDNSRAAILVISPNFLESGTCEHEARIALDNWINRRQKLIPIVKGNVEQANNSQVIKRIMKFITYIQWPENASEKEEDAFWRELENALDINMQRQTRVASFTRALANVFRCGRNGYSRVRNHVV